MGQYLTPLCRFVTSIDIVEATVFPDQTMTHADIRDIRRQHLNDGFLGFRVRAVGEQKQPDKRETYSRDDSDMMTNFSSLKLIRGVVYREVQSENGKKQQLVLPACYIETVLFMSS